MTLQRAGVCLGVAGLFLFSANEGLQTAVAEGDTRTLSFHHMHTDEDITITFKHNGRYDDAALKKLDWFMRDWRREESIKMDPHLFDLLWEAYREVGASEPIQVVCGFRSPATNAMLRARSTGVAQFSQHTQGQAMDFYIPGVPLEKIRIVGLRMQRGGVGFYPTSGSPFVHLDTGTIRHWPRMTHDQLAAVFPNGRTVHIPSDGHPLPGFALALAEVERNGAVPSTTSLEAAREAGVVTASNRPAPGRGLLARIFGGRTDADERSEEASEAQAQTQPQAPAPVRARAAMAMASLPKPVSTERIVPMPAARPKPVTVALAAVKTKPAEPPVTVTLAAAKTKPAEPPMVVAALPNNPFDTPGYWRGSVDTVTNAPKQPSPFTTASADPTAPISMGPALRPALAYAADAEPQAPARTRPMGAALQRQPETATLMPAAADTTVAIKPPLTTAMSQVTGTVADPWLRATILAPSATAFLTTTQFGAADPRKLQDLFYKPSTMLVMTFSADPHHGMAADRFSGRAVEFLATATFTRTASLR